MTSDFIVYFPAIATIVAALIAGGISLTNLIITKETKVSEFRQTWVDALRDDLTTFFSSARTFARVIQEMRHVSNTGDTTITALQFSQAAIGDIRHSFATSHHKIRLRLNRSQSDHLDLLTSLNEIVRAQKAYIVDVGADVEKVMDSVDAASDKAAMVLKGEWTRVKQGEPAYRSAVKVAKTIFIVAGLLLFVFVATIPLYSYYALPMSLRTVAMTPVPPGTTSSTPAAKPHVIYPQAAKPQ